MRTEESSLFRQPMSESRWQETLVALYAGIARMDPMTVERLARQIREAMDRLDPVMKRYCGITCPECKDPCCRAKNIFYNRADMLSIAALGIPAPPGQTRARHSAACRYLTAHGCGLDRAVRPYVCVWYLCDSQMELFREERAATQRFIVRQMEQLRQARLELEALFESSSYPGHSDFE